MPSPPHVPLSPCLDNRDAEPAGDQPTAAPAPVQGGDAPAEGGEGQRKKKNRGHKRRKTEPENLDPAEAARRARQRELRVSVALPPARPGMY